MCPHEFAVPLCDATVNNVALSFSQVCHHYHSAYLVRRDVAILTVLVQVEDCFLVQIENINQKREILYRQPSMHSDLL